MASTPAPASPLGPLLADIDRSRAVIRSQSGAQVRSAEARGSIRALAEKWFNIYRGEAAARGADVSTLDADFRYLHSASERAPSVAKVLGHLKKLRTAAVALQTALISSTPSKSADPAPSFAAVPDALMQKVLARRWDECVACLGAGAPLAATVMMGGLLESLFLARINREKKKAPIFTARAAPKDSKTGTALSLKDWGLGDYIAVAHELGWITQSGRDVSGVLQNYRNYIHPQKELASQAALTTDDAQMFWAVFKAIAARLL